MGFDLGDNFVTRFNDTCDVFQLNPGYLHNVNSSTNITFTLTKAAIYITNCSINSDITDSSLDSLLVHIEKFYQEHIDVVYESVFPEVLDPFSRSVVMVNYATCAVAVSGWMLFVAQALSISRKPFMLRIATLFLASAHTFLLQKFSKLMNRQFNECYQDNYEMIRLVSDSMAISAIYYLGQILVWANSVHCTRCIVQKLWQPLPDSTRRHDWRNVLKWSLIGYYFDVLLTMISAGIMHFYAVPFEDFPLTYGPNILEIVTTCIAYLYIIVMFSLFVMTRISFSFRFQSIVLIILIFAALFLAVILNIIWLVGSKQNMKWLIGVYLLFQLISTDLVYEFLINCQLYDTEIERGRIVGRRISVRPLNFWKHKKKDAVEFTTRNNSCKPLEHDHTRAATPE